MRAVVRTAPTVGVLQRALAHRIARICTCTHTIACLAEQEKVEPQGRVQRQRRDELQHTRGGRVGG